MVVLAETEEAKIKEGISGQMMALCEEGWHGGGLAVKEIVTNPLTNFTLDRSNLFASLTTRAFNNIDGVAFLHKRLHQPSRTNLTSRRSISINLQWDMEDDIQV